MNQRGSKTLVDARMDQNPPPLVSSQIGVEAPPRRRNCCVCPLLCHHDDRGTHATITPSAECFEPPSRRSTAEARNRTIQPTSCYWPPFWTYPRTNSSAFSSRTESISSRRSSTSSVSFSCRSAASGFASGAGASSISSSLRDLPDCHSPPVSRVDMVRPPQPSATLPTRRSTACQRSSHLRRYLPILP